jgi:hypothetical protein
MSAACVTKARLVNSRSYSDHDVNCNYMQDALKVSCVYLFIYISNPNNTIIIIKELRALFDRFTTTIFEHEQKILFADPYRALESIT